MGKPSCTDYGVLTVAPSKAVCAARGTNSELFANLFDGAIWSGYEPLPGVNAGPPSRTQGGVLALCGVRGTDNRLYLNVGP